LALYSLKQSDEPSSYFVQPFPHLGALPNTFIRVIFKVFIDVFDNLLHPTSPQEQTWELTSHGASEIRDHAVPDQAEIDKQLEHAQQQLDLTNVYPGRRKERI
jgi:hypothetical protein